jgi:16S rRNA (guanine966-N2)-methyltransferase
MRVVGGRFRGRALVSPVTSDIRPTSDRVREAVFNMLHHGAAQADLKDCKVLDLFAGTGALGIEALSRGAAQCLFVDDSAEARGLIRDNIEAMGLTGVTKIFRRDATALGVSGKYGAFNLVFMDPPYGKGMGERALASALSGGWLAPAATIVWEERRDAVIVVPAAVRVLEQRTWGDTQVCFAVVGAPVVELGGLR